MATHPSLSLLAPVSTSPVPAFDRPRLERAVREMLLQLSAVPGATVGRAELAGGGDVGDRAVDVQVTRLRRKIERDPANPLYLQTARGHGYRLIIGP